MRQGDMAQAFSVAEQSELLSHSTQILSSLQKGLFRGQPASSMHSTHEPTWGSPLAVTQKASFPPSWHSSWVEQARHALSEQIGFSAPVQSLDRRHSTHRWI